MGYGQLAQYAMRDTDLPLTSKAIYAFLCSLAGSGSTTFPSRDTIVSKLKIGKNVYYKYRQMLIDQGYISVEQHKTELGYFYRTDIIIEDNPKKFAADKRYQDNPSRTYGAITFTGIKAAGYGNICRTVMYDDRLSVKAKGLYAYFVSYAGAGNQAAPSQKTILYHLGINADSYHKYLAELTALNYLIVTQRHENGRLSGNDYCIVSNPDEDKAEQPKRTSKKRVILNSSPKLHTKEEQSHQEPKKGDTDEPLVPQGIRQEPKKRDTGESLGGQRLYQKPKKEDTVIQDTDDDDSDNQDPEKQDPVIRDNSNISSSSKINSSNISSLKHQSIYHSAMQTHWIDAMDRNAIKEYILEQIGFFVAPSSNKSMQNTETIISLVDLITTTIMKKTPTIRIGREEIPRCEAIDRLLSLDIANYDFVIDNVQKQTGHIRNVPAYYLTALYNSIETLDLCINRQEDEDFHLDESS